MKALLFASALLLAIPSVATADSDARVELTLSTASLSEGSSNWKGISLRPSLKIGERDSLNAELSWASRFDESGFFASANLVHDHTPDIYQILGAGASTSGAFWPKVQAYTSVYRKWLESRSLVTGIGVSGNRYDLSSVAGHEATGTDASSDLGATGEAIYYFPAPLIAECGYRYQLSFPGRIASHREYFAITWGYGLSYRIIGRYDRGTEGYRPVSVDTIAVKYDSEVIGLRGELDMAEGYTLALAYEYYRNEFYTRRAYSLGFVFKL